MQIGVRCIRRGDAEHLHRIFTGSDAGARSQEYFERLVSLHNEGLRWVIVGLADGLPVAYGSLLSDSLYPPFRERGIPEISNLNVVPRFRRMGIASLMLDEAERQAFLRSDVVGIGFGLHPGYRAAQRLYVLRGYVPDGNGLYWVDRFPQEREQVTLDDDLVLYLEKLNPA
jgi:GNAT superfamily N-acetyltransferase